MSEFEPQDALTHGSEKKVDLEQVEVGQSYTEPKPSFGQRAKRHCARRWWVHLIIFCASFLLIALLLVYVAMPRIAQNAVNESSLQFNYMEFLNPTADSITLSESATLSSPSIFTPTLDPFYVSIYLVTNGTLAAEPIMYISMPSIHATRPQGNVTINSQVIPIAESDRLTDFATAVLANENVTIAISGSTNLHEGALPVVNVSYNSQTTFKGLNALTGFNVTDAKFNLTAKAGEPNLSGFVYIPNPSIMTIAMGNVTLSLSTAQKGVIGNSTIYDMTLVPGNNTLAMTGILDQSLVIESTNSSGFVDLTITGQSAVYNGQHLPYYESALAGNKLTLTMNVDQIIADGGTS